MSNTLWCTGLVPWVLSWAWVSNIWWWWFFLPQICIMHDIIPWVLCPLYSSFVRWFEFPDFVLINAWCLASTVCDSSFCLFFSFDLTLRLHFDSWDYSYTILFCFCFPFVHNSLVHIRMNPLDWSYLFLPSWHFSLFLDVHVCYPTFEYRISRPWLNFLLFFLFFYLFCP